MNNHYLCHMKSPKLVVASQVMLISRTNTMYSVLGINTDFVQDVADFAFSLSIVQLHCRKKII